MVKGRGKNLNPVIFDLEKRVFYYLKMVRMFLFTGDTTDKVKILI